MNDASLDLLEMKNFALILLDENLRFIRATNIANNLLNAGTPLILNDEHLSVSKSKEDEQFQYGLNRSLHQRCYDVLFLSQEHSHSPLRIETYYIPNLNADKIGSQPGLAVHLQGFACRHELMQQHFQQFYGLTNAEVALANSIFQGLRLIEHAQTSHITVNTARGYLKSVFSKTGVASQTELKLLTERFSEL